MSTVYTMSDKRQLKIDDVTITISPLDYKTKADMQACVIAGRPMDAAVLALKHSIKGVSGLKLEDGSGYSLPMDPDGTVSDAGINDLLNIPQSSRLSAVCISLIHGMPQGEFIDPETGKPIKGVKFVKRGAAGKKSKSDSQ
jgi:hypothetical protein